MGRHRRSKEEFIRKCIEVHGMEYDYSILEYVSSNTRIDIICRRHGIFRQFPFSHINGAKCPKCANENRCMSTSNFIEKANKVHHNKYDYANTSYISNKQKVSIMCKEHGEFEQTPNDHLGGHGCPKCKSVSTGNLMRKSTLEFIVSSIKVHGELYDYSKVEYINNKKKVIITCKEHGDFRQIPNCHLRGDKCPKCKKTKKKTIEEILLLFRVTHGTKYDYSKVTYINMNSKVSIMCNIHGEFTQTPSAHITQSHGCPICRMSHGEAKIYKYLTEHSIEFKSQYGKLGIRSVGTLRFDFAVRVNGRIGVIEYNGIQHYEKVDGFKDFDGIMRWDSIKREQCKNKMIPLLVIPYKDFRSIDARLEEFLGDPSFLDAPKTEPLTHK